MARRVTTFLVTTFILLTLFLLAACSGGGGSTSSSADSVREPCPSWDLRTPCGRDTAGNYYRLLE